MSNLTFIGGGNMARSLISGLIANGMSSSSITVCEPIATLRDHLANDFAIRVTDDNQKAIRQADCIVLAVKPQVFKEVLLPLRDDLARLEPLIISVAAGITESLINTWCGGNHAIVRCMPNTPALLGEGATALYANQRVMEKQKTLATDILSAVGLSLWVEDETQLDAVTALSGSGPAYFFAFIEAMQTAGESLGLNSEQAKALTVQTALGAAKMADHSEESIDKLRGRVTSKEGTTAAALTSFSESNLQHIVLKAMTAAHDRSIELAKEFN